MGPESAQYREDHKAEFVEAGGGLEIQVDQVHDGPGHAAAIAFDAGQQLAQTQALAGIEEISGQQQQDQRQQHVTAGLC